MHNVQYPVSFVLITFLILFGNIHSSLANLNSPCSYPAHRIQCFIPHTITVFIFSSPKPSLYFPHSNVFYLLSPDPSPFSNIRNIASLPAPIVNPHSTHHPLPHDPIHIVSNPQYSSVNVTVPLHNASKQQMCEIPSADADIQPFHLNLKAYSMKMMKIQNSLHTIAIHIKDALATICGAIYIGAHNIYYGVKYYPYNVTFDYIIKVIYTFLSFTYTHECNVFIPLLSRILPSHLHHTAVQQINTILLFGSSVLIILLCTFTAVWLSYKNRINQYLNDSA